MTVFVSSKVSSKICPFGGSCSWDSCSYLDRSGNVVLCNKYRGCRSGRFKRKLVKGSMGVSIFSKHLRRVQLVVGFSRRVLADWVLVVVLFSVNTRRERFLNA